jgi:hypothetical protein
LLGKRYYIDILLKAIKNIVKSNTYAKALFMKIIILFLFTTLLLPAQAQVIKKKKFSTKKARHSKSSVGLKYFAATIGTGVLYGWRHVVYESDTFFIGGAGYTGQMGADQEIGTYSYGGLILGIDKSFGKVFSVDYGILAGGGGGKFTNLDTNETNSGGGIVLEPSLGMDWKIGKNSNFNLGLTQLLMPNNEDFTGSTVSLRVDFEI